MPRQLTGMVGVEHHDLSTALAVESQVAHRLLDDSVRLAGDDEAVVGEADVQTLPTAAQREQHRAGVDELMAPIATEPSNAATVRRNDSTSS